MAVPKLDELLIGKKMEPRYMEYNWRDIALYALAVGAKKKALVAIDGVDDKVIRSMSNIPGVKTIQADALNTYDILIHSSVIQIPPAEPCEAESRITQIIFD